MNFFHRKITYRLYPNNPQEGLMREWLGLHCRVYNTLLEEHRRRHEAKEKAFTFSAMCKALTDWRGTADSLARLNAQSLQVTAKRAALAFDAFFRRVKAGETAGYPRFKSSNRFSGWGYKTYGDGWKLRHRLSSQAFGYDALLLSGIGAIPMRGKGRFSGSPKTCEILHKAGKWYVSVTFSVAAHLLARTTGPETMAFDWGVNTLLTMAKSDGTVQTVDNPRWLKQKLESIKTLQRVISREEAQARWVAGMDPLIPLKPGQCQPMTAKLKRLYAQLRSLHGKIARQRKDFYHKLSAELVSRFSMIGTEALNIAGMTKAPKPKADPDNPGQFLPNGASQKAGLNRSILEAAPGLLIGMIKTKAEEAGSWFAEANTRSLKPTQRCHRCGTLVKKSLAERTHLCGCGCVCGRDENAAKTLLRWLHNGDFGSGTDPQKPSGSFPWADAETPPIAASAA